MLHSTLAGKSILAVSKLLGREGSTWPGHITLKTDPKFIRRAIEKNPGVKVVLIAGTNGKTTTTKALSHVLELADISVLTNQAGANLLNGLASMIVKHISLEGKLSHKALIFEVDENTLPLVLSEIPNPSCIVLLNLFRDQLDRYGEVNSTAEKWKESIEKLGNETVVIANGDDPLVAFVASTAKNKTFFSIDPKFKTLKQLDHAVDSITCPKCNSDLVYSGIAYSHLGNYRCLTCGFKNPEQDFVNIKTNLLGTYNQYNLNAVLLVSKRVFGLESDKIIEAFQTFIPAFGRQERIEVDGKKIMFLLSKNPTGMNESLKVVKANKIDSLLLLLNDRIPDGRDISWIWDVDFEDIRNKDIKVFISGDRAFDLANRLLFAGITHEVFEDYEMAYKESIKHTHTNQTLIILPTYSAMLDVRKLISGKSIL